MASKCRSTSVSSLENPVASNGKIGLRPPLPAGLGPRALMIAAAFGIVTGARVQCAPRMISYGYPNCTSCHVSVQGRGLLNSYGRGIDLAQSFSHTDFTGRIFGRAGESNGETWDGRFGKVLLDFVINSRVTHQLDSGSHDPTVLGLYRQAIFFGERDQWRLNTEIGYRDEGLNDTRLGPHLSTTGGDNLFLKKLLLEWRIEDNGSSGKEFAIGRDYLPIGLQIEDDTSFILNLTRNGLHDFPLQVKYFDWDEKSLGSVFLYAPTCDETPYYREFGGGFLYERYPSDRLAVGLQTVAGLSDEADRLRTGAYVRWGISNRWALLAETDYTHFWNGGSFQQKGHQITSFLQLFCHHREWLVSSLAANHAWSDLLNAGDHLYSVKYTLSARLARNFTVGLSYAHGNILRNLGHAKEATVFANIKF